MKCALVVLDAQKIYTHRRSEMYCPDARKTIDRINRLIKLFDKQNMPVVYVRHQHKKDGSDTGRLFDFAGEAEEGFNFVEGTTEVEYDSKLLRPSNAPEIVKTRYSAFQGTKLDQELKRNGVERVVICGFMTNFCCESTAREALDRDYYVDFVVDATGTPGIERVDEEKVRKQVAAFLAAGYARVFRAKEYMASEK